MAGHIPGSLHAPPGTDFATIVGSYVYPSTNIYLLVDSASVDEAVRTLVRIGYDRIVGYAPPATLLASGVAEEVTPIIEFGDLDADIDPDAYTILDVRGAAEYAESHLPGAMNIAHTRLANRINEVVKDKPILAYCRTGNRAAAAVSLLMKEGYNVTLVDGMFSTWPGVVARPHLGANPRAPIAST